MLWVILVILLILMLAGLPNWPYHPTPWHGAGYYPSGIIGLILLVVIILLLFRLL